MNGILLLIFIVWSLYKILIICDANHDMFKIIMGMIVGIIAFAVVIGG